MSENQDQQGASGMRNPLADCQANTPAATRIICYICGFASITGLFGLGGLTANCPERVFLSSGAEFYRVLFAAFFEISIFNGLVGCFSFFQLGKRIEAQKGSVFLFYQYVVSALYANLFFFIICSLALYNPWSPPPQSWRAIMCMYGVWPSVFSLMVVETQMSTDPFRQCICCPFDIPTKVFPLFLFGIFALFSLVLGGGPSPGLIGMFFGLLTGYLMARVSAFGVSENRLRSLENSPRMTWLTESLNYVSLDTAGTVLPYSAAMSQAGGAAGAPDDRSYGGGYASGRGASNAATINSQPNTGGSAAAAPSPFTGQGYSLGSSSSVSSNTSSARPTGRRGPTPAMLAKMTSNATGDRSALLRNNEPSDAFDGSALEIVSGGREAVIGQIMELGYTKADAEYAYSNSDGSFEGAVDYLTS